MVREDEVEAFDLSSDWEITSDRLEKSFDQIGWNPDEVE